MNRFGVIVDGYSTGAGLVEKFLEKEIRCIHVQSQQIIPKFYAHTYSPELYCDHYIFSGNLKPLINTLQHYNVEFVIAGAESGIELADSLCEALNLPGNGTELSAARRNKYLMWEQVKSKNVQVIPSMLAETLEIAIDWVIEQNTWPLIVKPLNSAGGEGVRVCNAVLEIKTAFLNIMNTRINTLGFENKGVILQHYIGGEEYVVNTVSFKGKHKFCELWNYSRYKRSEGRNIYDTAKLINFDPAMHEEVVNYAFKVIHALGIQYGPMHVEIIKNENGCYLIEVGARLMGANLPFSLLATCVSTPQWIHTIAAYAEPKEFIRKLDQPYKILHPLVAVFMISNQTGKISSIDHIEKIHSLSSFYAMKLAIKEREILRKTIDYQTSPGMIYLSHDDPDVIKNDIEIIRQLEKNMFIFDEKTIIA